MSARITARTRRATAQVVDEDPIQVRGIVRRTFVPDVAELICDDVSGSIRAEVSGRRLNAKGRPTRARMTHTYTAHVGRDARGWPVWLGRLIDVWLAA